MEKGRNIRGSIARYSQKGSVGQDRVEYELGATAERKRGCLD